MLGPPTPTSFEQQPAFSGWISGSSRNSGGDGQGSAFGYEADNNHREHGRPVLTQIGP